MQCDYKDFHIDASPLDEGGHYYARAKIYRRASVGGDTVEVKWSGDLGDYPSDAAAIEAAQRWAIQWCDENSAKAERFDSSNQMIGDSDAALQCLSRISWQAIQRSPAWRSCRFRRQCNRAAGPHNENQQQLELHGLRKLAVPEYC